MSIKIEQLRQKVTEIESRTTSSSTKKDSINFNQTNTSSVNLFASQKSDDQARIRWSAMDLLSRREHSKKELQRKLLQRYPDNEVEINLCIEKLEEEGLQSNSRFCEDYVNMRKRKGYGPYKILNDLREKGITEELAKHYLYREGNDWFDVAKHLWERKYQGHKGCDYKSQSKQARFLQGRGFNQDIIVALVY